MRTAEYVEVFEQIKGLLKKEDLTVVKGLTSVCEFLNKNLKAYDWVGFWPHVPTDALCRASQFLDVSPRLWLFGSLPGVQEN